VCAKQRWQERVLHCHQARPQQPASYRAAAGQRFGAGESRIRVWNDHQDGFHGNRAQVL
jgi:hypothetical protein